MCPSSTSPTSSLLLAGPKLAGAMATPHGPSSGPPCPLVLSLLNECAVSTKYVYSTTLERNDVGECDIELPTNVLENTVHHRPRKGG